MKRVCPSFPPAICPSIFLELDHKISLNFGMVLETPYEVVHDSLIF